MYKPLGWNDKGMNRVKVVKTFEIKLWMQVKSCNNDGLNLKSSMFRIFQLLFVLTN